jgi:hypothetical protein
MIDEIYFCSIDTTRQRIFSEKKEFQFDLLATLIISQIIAAIVITTAIFVPVISN